MRLGQCRFKCIDEGAPSQNRLQKLRKIPLRQAMKLPGRVYLFEAYSAEV